VAAASYFLDPRVLTEDDVLEIRETQIQGRRVELSGRELQSEGSEEAEEAAEP
jgi:hypothetical protein